MGEPGQAQYALYQQFQRDLLEERKQQGRKPTWRPRPGVLPWLIAMACVLVVVGPFAFLFLYPHLGPYDTMTAFCTAEFEADYGTAYSLLSTRAQQHTSLAAFTRVSRDANVQNCDAGGSIPFIVGGTGTRAQYPMDYTAPCTDPLTGAPTGGNCMESLNGTMSFVREPGGWRVDAMTPDYFNLSS
jgi:hypothetical protein